MSKPKAAAKLDPAKELKATYYRVDRKSTYSWQAYRLRTFTDGSMIEDQPLKEDVLHITLRKIGDLMKDEGQALFEVRKREAIELQKAQRAQIKAVK